MIDGFLTFFITYGGALSITMALGYINLKQKTTNSKIASSLYMFIGIFQLLNGLLLYIPCATLNRFFPLVQSFRITLFFCIAPITYFYFKGIISESEVDYTDITKHFSPILVPFLVLLVFGLLKVNSTFFNNNIHYSLLLKSNPIYNVLAIGSVISNVLYALISLRVLIQLLLRKDRERSSLIISSIILLVLFLVMLLLWSFSYINKSFLLQKISHSLITVEVLALFIIGKRITQLMHIEKIEAVDISNQTSRITGIDVYSILNKLTKLLDDEKIYTDEKVNIKSVSKMLNIPSYQLSEIINTYLNTNFQTYINEKRILESKRKLSATDDTITEIIYAIGFSSPSTFYTAFKKYTGFSPTDYRKWCIEDKATPLSVKLLKS